MTTRPAADRRTILFAALVLIALALAIYAEVWLGVIHPHGWADDFNIYYTALESAQAGHSPYFPYIIGISFVYHPFALTLVSLFGLLGRFPASILWAALNVVGYALSLWMSLKLVGDVPEERRWLIIALFAIFAPMWEMLHIGQINGIVLACLIGSLYLSEQDRPILAGIVLALAIVLKSSPLVFVLWFLAVRRWKVAVAALAMFGVFSLIAWGQFGTGVVRDYFAVLARLGTETHPDFYNQSLPAIAIRVLWTFGIKGIETSAALMQKLGMTLLIGMTLGLTAAAPLSNQRLRVWLFALLGSIMTVASPLVWYHHNMFLMLPLVILLVWPVVESWQFWAGIVIYFLIQAERLIEEYAPQVPYDYTAPDKHLMGTQAFAGLPVLIAQGVLIIVIGWAILQWFWARSDAGS